MTWKDTGKVRGTKGNENSNWTQESWDNPKHSSVRCQPLGAILITFDNKIINRRDIFVNVFCEIIPREQYDPSQKTGLALGPQVVLVPFSFVRAERTPSLRSPRSQAADLHMQTSWSDLENQETKEGGREWGGNHTGDYWGTRLRIDDRKKDRKEKKKRQKGKQRESHWLELPRWHVTLGKGPFTLHHKQMQVTISTEAVE